MEPAECGGELRGLAGERIQDLLHAHWRVLEIRRLLAHDLQDELGVEIEEVGKKLIGGLHLDVVGFECSHGKVAQIARDDRLRT